ncbi:laccase domain-containing protein [Roseomonas sp. JC162]|uniref:Laccase domain-containing protein n=1 Tax=Neoroseomonas marina TaxID=1232220 RepID=A0A848EE86_9PROT|nr:polyphenol oxidase family protein [Neoroseomonas marina]NMJ42904.1 laccase domain-containing protein [Neoroseomonas marina]
MAQFVTAESLAAESGLAHAFFTRRGGVSAGPFAALNCSLSGKDDPDAVRENRRRAADALGVAPGSLAALTQVHGPDVAVVETLWPDDDRPKADAMVTRRPGVALGIVTADCAPVLFADPAAGVIGAAHAGWRSAVGGVLEATIAAMLALGARREAIVTAVGPCIRQPSYEVAADLRDAVLARDPAHARFFADGRREGRWQFDLAGYCAARLSAAGAGVEITPYDTLALEGDFFSHRRNTLAGGGPIGHQLSAIALAV